MEKIKPNFDLTALKPNGNDNLSPEAIKSDVNSPVMPESKSHEDVLTELLPKFKPLDFESLAFPGLNGLRKELSALDAKVKLPDGSYKQKKELDENERGQFEADWEKHQAINKKIKRCKLIQNHLIVLSIEHLQKVAEENDWAICRNGNAIFVFNGIYWRVIDQEAFAKFLGEAAERMGIEKFTARIYRFRDELLKQFMNYWYLPTPKPDLSIVLMNLQNGTLEVSPDKQPRLRPFSKADFLTHVLPFQYDPTAKATIWEKYLNRVLPDKGKQKLLQEFMGYVFIRNGSGLKLEKCLLMYGSGANGKSVSIDVFTALFGEENISVYNLESLTDKDGYRRAEILGKLLNITSELNTRMEPDVFKKLASGEPVEARAPYGKPFMLTQYPKFVFATNVLPRDVEQTFGFFRRFIIIEFAETIPEKEQDKTLAKTIIENELSGVLNWILTGLKGLLSQKGFSACDAVDKMLEQYRKNTDTVATFIEELNYTPLNAESDFNEPILMKTLYSEYKEFCDESGFKRMNKNTFRNRLESLQFLVKRENDGYNVYARQKTADEKEKEFGQSQEKLNENAF